MSPRIACAVLAATLAGCGGGELCEPVRIQLFGDSTQAGFDGGTRTMASVPPGVALQAALDERFGAGAVVVEVRAVSGTNSVQLVDGSDGLNRPWPGSVDADIVIINHGINDSYYGTPMVLYAANLRAFTQTRAVVLLETPSPVHGRDFTSDKQAEAVRRIAAAYGVQLVDTAAYVQDLPGWRDLIPDGVHPNEDLYGRIARDVLLPAVALHVARLNCKGETL